MRRKHPRHDAAFADQMLMVAGSRGGNGSSGRQPKPGSQLDWIGMRACHFIRLIAGTALTLVGCQVAAEAPRSLCREFRYSSGINFHQQLMLGESGQYLCKSWGGCSIPNPPPRYSSGSWELRDGKLWFDPILRGEPGGWTVMRSGAGVMLVPDPVLATLIEFERVHHGVPVISFGEFRSAGLQIWLPEVHPALPPSSPGSLLSITPPSQPSTHRK